MQTEGYPQEAYKRGYHLTKRQRIQLTRVQKTKNDKEQWRTHYTTFQKRKIII